MGGFGAQPRMGRPRGFWRTLGRGLIGVVRGIFLLLLMIIPVPGMSAMAVRLIHDRRSHPTLVDKGKEQQ